MEKIKVSAEFFPTATPEGADKLAQVRQELKNVAHWEYFSVTYGAGGSTRERTMHTVQRILNEGHTVMPHLTCVTATRGELEALLREYQTLGVNHLMALRGDMPSGAYEAGDLNDARDLVRLTREVWGEKAKIYVAAYPEFHPRAKSPQADIEFLVEKFKAGADEAVTQLFFNPDAYLRFRDDVAKYGVNQPIVPGIMPITNYTQIARFTDGCGAEIPRWLRKRLENASPESLPEYGADAVAQLCARLIQEGVRNFHFYSMNKSEPILAILKRLGQ